MRNYSFSLIHIRAELSNQIEEMDMNYDPLSL